MTVTATYLSDLGRVRVAFSAAPTGTDYATVERSTDGITWATVRGGDAVAVVSGAGKLDDYEFDAGLANTYRVTYIDSADVTRFGSGTFTTGNNATLVPPLPTGAPNGAMLLLYVTHANTAATITTPAGWTPVPGNYNHMAVFYRVMSGSVTAPSVSFAGGATGDSCSAIITAWTNADVPTHVTAQTNASSQNVATPGATLAANGLVWLMHEWKKSVGTGASLPTSQFEADPIGGFNTAGANNESQITWRTLASNNVQLILPATTTWTGGSAAVSKARLLRLTKPANVGQETASITPNIGTVWFKVPARPSLNTPVTVSWDGQISRPSRTGLFDVLGRTYPIAVTDVQGSRRLTLMFITQTVADANDLDRRLASGEPVFIQAPAPDSAIPTLYAILGDITQTRPSYTARRRYFTVPLVEVAAPGATVYSDTYTYADVIADYASYSAVLAGVATYSDLIDKISDNEVVVP